MGPQDGGLNVTFMYASDSISVTFVETYIQSVPGGMDKISGECSLC